MQEEEDMLKRINVEETQSLRERVYFLILEYLRSDESFDRDLLSKIKRHAESEQLLGTLLSLDGTHLQATFEELHLQQRGRKKESLDSILNEVYREERANQKGNLSQKTQSVLQERVRRLSEMFQNPSSIVTPPREMLMERKRKNRIGTRENTFVNEAFLLRFKHLKTCFGHAYSADSGSVNEESGEPYIPIYNTAFDKSGRLVITADEEGLIKVWSADNGLLLSNLKGHTSGILSNDVSPCNQYLVTCSIDFTARVWDIFNQRCLTAFKSPEQLNAVVFYKYATDFMQQLYLIIMTNLGNIIIYKEDQFKNNNGGSNPELKPVITLSMRKVKKSHDPKEKDAQNEAVCIETHPDGYLVVGTEIGEILVWEKIHTLENRNRTVMPIIEIREHSKNCQLIKFSPSGEFMITASFDGYAKIWPWKKVIDNDKKLSDSIYSLYFDNTNKCEKNCWNVGFSCKSKYAFATFTRKMKRSNDVETVVYAYDLMNQVIKQEFSHSNTPAKLQDHILVFEPHPTLENILLTADYSGQIIIYDVEIGCILNVFQERGFHIGYPNLEVPVLDGCWSPDGMKFLVSTYYGSFSLYGYDSEEMYKTTPTEQFFANDTDIFIFNDNHVALAVDDEMEINLKSRGKICDYQRIPYCFEYHNDLKILLDKGFFQESTDFVVNELEKRMKELSLQQTNTNETQLDRALKINKKETQNYLNLCSQLSESYTMANASMEGSQKIDYIERMEILKKMSTQLHNTYTISNEQPQQLSQSISASVGRIQHEQQPNIPRNPAARRRIIEDDEQENIIQTTSSANRRLPLRNTRNTQRRGNLRSTQVRNYRDSSSEEADDDEDEDDEEIQDLKDESEVNLGEMKDELEEDMLEEHESAEDYYRGSHRGIEVSSNYEEGMQRRTRLRRFSNNRENEAQAGGNTNNRQRNVLRFNRNTRSSYNMQHVGDQEQNETQNLSRQDNDSNYIGTSRLRRRNNQRLVDEEEDQESNDVKETINSHHEKEGRRLRKRSQIKRIYDDDDEDNEDNDKQNADEYTVSEEANELDDDEEEDDANYDGEEEEDYAYSLKKTRNSFTNADRIRQEQPSTSKKSMKRQRTRSRLVRGRKENGNSEEDEEYGEIDEEFEQTKPSKNKKALKSDSEDEEVSESEEFTGMRTSSNKKNSNSKKRTISETGLNHLSTRSSQTHKKLKINEEEDDDEEQEDANKHQKNMLPTKQNNGRIQNLNGDQKSLCDRCKKECCANEMSHCDKCERKYDSKCGKLRGGMKDRKYYCFDCYGQTIRSSKEMEDRVNLLRDQLEQEETDLYRFIPQLDDQVYYIPQAHEQFCETYFEIFDYTVLYSRMKETGQEFAILPFTKNESLQKEQMCRVSFIQYVYPTLNSNKMIDSIRDKPIFMLLTLEVLNSKQVFSIYYANTQNINSFLIPSFLYHSSMELQNTIKINQNVQFYKKNILVSATFVEQIQTESPFMNSVWQTMRVKINPNQERLFSRSRSHSSSDKGEVNLPYLKLSCWDVFQTELNEKYISESGCVSIQEGEQVCQLIEAMKQNQNQDTFYFEEPVNLKKYKQYLDFIELPMDISKIERRLKNRYYRSLDSMLLDVNLICSNSFKFNDPDSEVCQSATKVKDLLTGLLSSFQNVEQALSLVIKNKKHLKQALAKFFPQTDPSHAVNHHHHHHNNNLSIQTNQNAHISHFSSNQTSIKQVPQQSNQFIEKLVTAIPIPITNGTRNAPKYPVTGQQLSHFECKTTTPSQMPLNNKVFESNSSSNQLDNLPYEQSNQNGFILQNSNQTVYPSQNPFGNIDYDDILAQNLSSHVGLYYNDYSHQANNGTMNSSRDNNQNQVLTQQSQLQKQSVQSSSDSQQRTTRSGRLTRNSSKYDYDQVEPRKN